MELNKQVFQNDRHNNQNDAAINATMDKGALSQEALAPTVPAMNIAQAVNSFPDLCRLFFEANQANREDAPKNTHKKEQKNSASLEKSRLILLANSLIDRWLMEAGKQFARIQGQIDQCYSFMDEKGEDFSALTKQIKQQTENKDQLNTALEESQKELEEAAEQTQVAKIAADQAIEEQIRAGHTPESIKKAEDAELAHQFMQNKSAMIAEGQDKIRQEIAKTKENLKELKQSASDNIEGRIAEINKLKELHTKQLQIKKFEAVGNSPDFSDSTTPEELKEIWQKTGVEAHQEMAEKDGKAKGVWREIKAANLKHQELTKNGEENNIEALAEIDERLKGLKGEIKQIYSFKAPENTRVNTPKNSPENNAPSPAPTSAPAAFSGTEQSRTGLSAAAKDGLGIQAVESISSPFQMAASGVTPQEVILSPTAPSLNKEPEPIIQVAALG